LTGIELFGTYGTKSNVFGTMIQRYKSVTIDTVMGVFLSSNILGNPGKFFNGISSGFNDLFDIPAREFQKGPLDGMVGIGKGTASFIGKTIGATFDSVHNISDALASGVIAFSGDTDYMIQRERINQQKNKNIIDGTYKAANAIASGFFFGVTGITLILT
jgi:vacuolar protein sorting-associated protein 13A/C